MVGTAPKSQAIKLKSILYREYVVTEALLRSNAGTTLGGFLFAILPRLLLPPIPVGSAAQLILKTCVLSVSFQYALDIVNQTTGVTEDSINKPYRPIPSGLITIHEAERRWTVVWILFPILSYLLSGHEAAFWAILWQAEVGFCYVWPKPNNPVMRNMFTGVATFIIISLVNAIVVHEHADRDLNVILRAALGVWAGIVIQIQEFHDVEGDRMAGKRTLPLVLGEDRIWLMRQVTCGIFVVSHALFLGWGIALAQSSAWPISICAVGSLQIVLGVAVGVRVVWSESVEMDKKSYFYWLTLLFWMMVIYITLLGTAM